MRAHYPCEATRLAAICSAIEQRRRSLESLGHLLDGALARVLPDGPFVATVAYHRRLM
jgi:hypothetical protein